MAQKAKQVAFIVFPRIGVSLDKLSEIVTNKGMVVEHVYKKLCALRCSTSELTLHEVRDLPGVDTVGLTK